MTQTYTPNVNFEVGAVIQPLDPALGLSMVQQVDPTIFFALDFWAWVIRNYPGQGLLLDALTKSGVRDANRQPLSDAVAQAYSDDPVPYLGSTYLRFPCLAVYRKETEYMKHSAGYYSDKTKFDLIYILPALDAAQANNVLPILTAVEKAIRQKTVQSFDPGYTPPGGNLGDSPWWIAYTAVQEIGFDRSARLKLEPTGGTNMVFPCLLMSGTVIERDMYLPGPKFAGGDITTSLVDADGTVLTPFVQASTQGPPTLTNISPTSGVIAGGTGITFNGTLFLPEAKVLIGARPATSVVVASNGLSLTCVSPQADGSGVVNVTLTNKDGQQASLSQAYSFV